MIAKQKSADHYESTWNRVGSIVGQEIDLGQGRADILATIVRTLAEDFFTIQPFLDYYRQVGIEFDSCEQPKHRIIVRDGAYRLVPFDEFDDSLVSRTLSEFINGHRSKIDCSSATRRTRRGSRF